MAAKMGKPKNGKMPAGKMPMGMGKDKMPMKNDMMYKRGGKVGHKAKGC